MVVSTLRLLASDTKRFLPVVPNWSTPFKAAYEFKTDIITSWDGKEQRRAVRANPRRQLSFMANAWAEGKLSLDYFMASWMTKPTLMPDFVTFVDIIIEMDAEATSAVVDGDMWWVKPGMTVAIYNRKGVMETRTVLALASNNIIFVESTDTVFSVGARISPVFEGRVQVTPKVPRATSATVGYQVQFDVDPGTFDYTPAAGNTYSGFREAFSRKPDWKGGIDVDHVWPRETVDYEFGRVAHFVPYLFPGRISRMDFLGRSYADVKTAVDFFHRHRGRWREFVVPTWENDVPYSFIGAGSSSVLISGQNFGRVHRDSTVFRRIVLRHVDGSLIHRAVDYIEVLEDTDSSVLWTTESLPTVPLTPATLHGISWGLVSRFATDRLEVEWLTDSVAQFSMTFQSLENYDL